MKKAWDGAKNAVTVFDESGNYKTWRYCISHRNYNEASSKEYIAISGGEEEDIYGESSGGINSLNELTQAMYDKRTSPRLRYWYIENLKQSSFKVFVDKDINYRIPVVTLEAGNHFKEDIIKTSLIRFLWEYPYMVYIMWYLKTHARVDFECAFILAHGYCNYLNSGHSFLPSKYWIKNLYPKVCDLKRIINSRTEAYVYKCLQDDRISLDVENLCDWTLARTLKYIGYTKSFVPIDVTKLNFSRPY